jgi:predicted unusual protein kinase regulating ubiquinone biosynthesis (AarF/ABC1/UbiB family)
MCQQTSDAYKSAISGCHKRSAERILLGCLQNGGLYIKLGQGLVSMNHILPKEYLDTLVVLQDQALTSKTSEVLFSSLQTLTYSTNAYYGTSLPLTSWDIVLAIQL